MLLIITANIITAEEPKKNRLFRLARQFTLKGLNMSAGNNNEYLCRLIPRVLSGRDSYETNEPFRRECEAFNENRTISLSRKSDEHDLYAFTMQHPLGECQHGAYGQRLALRWPGSLDTGIKDTQLSPVQTSDTRINSSRRLKSSFLSRAPRLMSIFHVKLAERNPVSTLDPLQSKILRNTRNLQLQLNCIDCLDNRRRRQFDQSNHSQFSIRDLKISRSSTKG